MKNTMRKQKQHSDNASLPWNEKITDRSHKKTLNFSTQK